MSTADDTWIDEGAAEPARPRVGGRYELLALIGEGSMGTVYRARDLELDELVALKILKGDDDPRVLARVRQEVKLARRVTHPNVVRTFDLGEEEGTRFVTMELLDGGSLAERIADQGRLRPQEARLVATGLCRGLQAAHEAGVVHRDVKPANIMLGAPDRDGLPSRVAVGDFGIAASPGTASRDGTPAYMAPEQGRGEPVDPRTDVYAVGVVLFEMLTGRRPPGLVPSCAELNAIAQRCLQADPGDRFPSAEALLGALSQAQPVWMPEEHRPARPSARARVVVVRPFETKEVQDGWLGRSLSSELTEMLERSPGLRARRGDDPAGADALVESRLDRVDGEVTLRLRLTGVRDGFRLLEVPFHFAEAHALEVVEVGAQRIAAALNGDLPASTALPADPATLGALLRAREGLREGWTLGELGRVRVELDDLVDKAPDEPMVWSTLALLRAREAFRAPDEASVDRLLSEAEAAAERTLAAVPDSGEGWLARGLVALYGRDPAAGAQALVRAARQAPGNPRIQTLLGALLLEVGDLDGAERHLDAALAVNPELADAYAERARLAAYREDWRAVEAYTPVSWDQPAQSMGAATLRLRLRLWSAEVPDVPPVPEAAMRQLETSAPWYLRLYRVLEAVVRHRRTDGQMRPPHVPNARLRSAQCQVAAEGALSLGAPAVALELVEAAVDAGCIDLQWMDHCPAIAPLRTDPAFRALRDEVAERAEAVRAALLPEAREAG